MTRSCLYCSMPLVEVNEVTGYKYWFCHNAECEASPDYHRGGIFRNERNCNTMIKVFCDVCEKDITNYSNSRMIGKNGRVTVEVITAVDGVWNGGHVCESCIEGALSYAKINKKESKGDGLRYG